MVISALAFVLVSRVVVKSYRSTSDGSAIPVLFDKLQALQRVLPQTDIVVIGSSHVYRNFDPKAFDEAMAGLGCPVRSFNMGVAGMNINEANFIVDAMAGEHAPDWLLLENLPPVRPSSFGNERSRRFMRLDTLPLAVRDILSAGVSGPRRLRILGLVLYAHAYEEAGTGMLASRLIGDGRLDAKQRDYFSWGDSDGRQGYLALEDETAPQFAARRQRHLDTLAAFDRALAHYASDQPKREAAARRVTYLREVLDAAAETGPRVALVTMPNPEDGGFSKGLELGASNGELAHPLINLNDPARFTWLTDPAAWFDSAHLTRDASARLSEALAKDFCSVMRAD
ncbi:MAG: hypothetical protein AAFN78_02670 [Pseudomonadota bacterium]